MHGNDARPASTTLPLPKGRPDHYWEDLVAGDVIRTAGMTITEAHLVQWAGLTGDLVSLHLDETYAATTPFGQRIAHGPLTMSLGLGLMTQTGYFNNVVAGSGSMRSAPSPRVHRRHHPRQRHRGHGGETKPDRDLEDQLRVLKQDGSPS
jgi:hypothetical protein